MSESNLYLQSDWLHTKNILRLTIFSINKGMMVYWSDRVFQAIKERKNPNDVRLLFDLSHPNVSMSYYVLTGRKLLNAGVTLEGRQRLINFLEDNPACELKLAVLLSNTMLAALSKHVPEKFPQKNFTGKIFFDTELAEEWLAAEQPAQDVKTGVILTDELEESLSDLPESDPEIFGNRTQLRLLVMGSLEVVSIVENEPIIIGRGADSDINVRSYGQIARSVSRHHAQIILQNGRLSITDLGSRNGTMVSGRQLEPHKAAFIRRDDAIKIGLMEISIIF